MREWSTVPNLLTYFRLVMIPVIALLIARGEFRTALPLLFITGMTDAFDGFLARKLNQQTRLGAILDPIADKALLVTVYIGLGWAGALPVWMVALVLGRDAAIMIFAIVVMLTLKRRDFPPTTWGKISTFYQLWLAGFVVFHGAWPGWMPNEILLFMLVTTAAATLVSGFDYLHVGWGWIRRA